MKLFFYPLSIILTILSLSCTEQITKSEEQEEQVASDTIYNGIVLPDEWPPNYDAITRNPMPPVTLPAPMASTGPSLNWMSLAEQILC